MKRANPYVLLFALLAASALPGCQSTPVAATQPSTDVLGVATTQPETTLGNETLPGLPPVAVSLRSGSALMQAQLPLPKIIASLPQPRYLAATTQPAAMAPSSAPSKEPAVAAQHAYLRAKRAFLERRAFDAIRELQAAEQIEPNSPEIIRLLGTIYISSGSNKARGATYLERAVQLAPYDVESFFYLGSAAMEQGRSGMPTAIATFAHALSLKGNKLASDADPAIWPLLQAFMGTALENQGYDQAAIDAFTAFMTTNPNYSRSTSFGRLLYGFSRQQNLLLQSIGDAKMRLGDARGAIEAYKRALEGETYSSRNQSLVSRVIYAQVIQGKIDDAIATTSEYLRVNKADPGATRYLSFLAANTANKAKVVKAMQVVYDDAGRPTTLALALADLMPEAEAVEFLRKHLDSRPRDAATFERLVHIFTNNLAGPEGMKKAVGLVAKAMVDASPTQARSLAMTLVGNKDDQTALLGAIDSMPAAEQQQANVGVIKGLSLLQARREADARVAFEQALAAKGDLIVARVELVRLLLSRNDIKAAEAAMAPIATRTDATIVPLRVEVLLRSGKQAEAVKLLDQLIAAEPLNAMLPMQKAMLQRLTKDVAGAERTLEEALDRFPQNEDVYAALYDLYDSPAGEQLPDATQSWQRLLKRVLGAMPNSRIARLMSADWAGAHSEFDRQLKLLDSLLSENPNDFRALSKLIEAYDNNGKQTEALTIIQARITKDPTEKNLYAILLKHYQAERNKPKILETSEKMLLLETPSPERSRELAMVYLLLNRNQDAIKVLREGLAMPSVVDPTPLLSTLRRATNKTNEPDIALTELNKAIARFPDLWPEVQLELAMFYDHANKKDEAEKVMLLILEKKPDHHQTLNSLGYAWADQGRNLERARTMIQAAVDAEPNSAAYLDSLGWVYYKMGNFKTATQWLQRAVAAPGGNHPVLLSHLGDALYRQGEAEKAKHPNEPLFRSEDTAKAQQIWGAAQMRMVDVDEMDLDDPELVGLGKKLREKIDAVNAKKIPAVAPLGKDVKATTQPAANVAK